MSGSGRERRRAAAEARAAAAAGGNGAVGGNDNNGISANGSWWLRAITYFRRFGLLTLVVVLFLGESIAKGSVSSAIKLFATCGAVAAVTFIIWLLFFSGWPERATRGPK